jgi:hypothetical protein
MRDETDLARGGGRGRGTGGSPVDDCDDERVLASLDWVAAASVSTAVATLVLALATFAAVRSAQRTARISEQSLAAQLWPLLAPARPEDPEQKVLFQDQHKVMVSGGLAAAEATSESIYFAIAIRNVGPGLAVLDRWWFAGERRQGAEDHADESDFRRLTRDLYLPPGEIGYWQGAIRDPGSPEFAIATAAIRNRQEMTVELLYSDYLGHQRTISRFILMPVSEGRWFVALTRHWNLDRPDPRPRPDGATPSSPRP